MHNVFCLMVLNRYTWFNMGRIRKDDRFLIKNIKPENITHKHNMVEISVHIMMLLQN